MGAAERLVAGFNGALRGVELACERRDVFELGAAGYLKLKLEVEELCRKRLRGRVPASPRVAAVRASRDKGALRIVTLPLEATIRAPFCLNKLELITPKSLHGAVRDANGNWPLLCTGEQQEQGESAPCRETADARDAPCSAITHSSLCSPPATGASIKIDSREPRPSALYIHRKNQSSRRPTAFIGLLEFVATGHSCQTD